MNYMKKQNKKESTSVIRESLVKDVNTSKITSGVINADELNFINTNSNR